MAKNKGKCHTSAMLMMLISPDFNQNRDISIES